MGFYSQIISLTEGKTLNNADMEKAKSIFCEENLVAMKDLLKTVEPEKQEELNSKIKRYEGYRNMRLISFVTEQQTAEASMLKTTKAKFEKAIEKMRGEFLQVENERTDEYKADRKRDEMVRMNHLIIDFTAKQKKLEREIEVVKQLEEEYFKLGPFQKFLVFATRVKYGDYGLVSKVADYVKSGKPFAVKAEERCA